MKVYLITYKDTYDGDIFLDETIIFLNKEKALNKYETLIKDIRKDLGEIYHYYIEEDTNSPEDKPFYKYHTWYEDGDYCGYHIELGVSEREVIE